ncbi:hypothetical protein [Arthrobacter sp. CP30]
MSNVIDQLVLEIDTPDDEKGVERAHRNASEPWKTVAMRALEAEAASGLTFDSYTLEAVRGVPEADHPNRWGGLFHAAAKRGVIRKVGYHQSLRPGRSGGVCAVWVGSGQP